MIFKNLFKPKYQNPDPQIRINAIESLSPELAEQKTQLHELAFNDDDPNVILAALSKLNSFALWCKTAEIAKSERVRKKAQAVVESALFETGNLELSDTDRKRFIQECKSIALLEKLLKLEWLLNDDTGLLYHVLNKINKEQLNKNVLLTTKSEQVQLHLLKQIDDQNVLNKMLKKPGFESIHELVKSKLNELLLKKTKPVEVEKRARLVLSQMLVLKDHLDLDHIHSSMLKLNADYEQISAEFECLRTEVKENLVERFQQIKQQVNRQIDRIGPEWHAKNQILFIENNISVIEKDIKAAVNEMSASFGANIQNITQENIDEYSVNFSSLQNRLDALRSEVSDVDDAYLASIEGLAQQVDQLQSILIQFPNLQQSVSAATEHLERFEKLEKPNDISQIEAAAGYLSEQKRILKQLKTPFLAYWPRELNQQWKAMEQEWNLAIKGLKSDIKQNEAKCRNILKTIESMIQQGKFKAAIALYTKSQKLYRNLPEKNQTYLSRSFSKITEQIENLKDWQAYIAQPRKPALLEEVKALLQNKVSIEEQAKAVKHLRNQWNSLGNADTEADRALNQVFEQDIEKAFEPCRMHFAEQEKQRDANAQTKRTLIETLHNINVNDLDAEQLSKRFIQIQKDWRLVGKIDYKLVDELNQQYQQALVPIKQKVESFYQSNMEAKQALINKLVKLLGTDDSAAATEQAKKLQIAWKNIGFAGDKIDRRLWNEFRQMNDRLFANRQKVKTIEKQKFTEQKEQFEASLNGTQQRLEQATNINEIDSILAELATLIDSVEPSLNKVFSKKVSSIRKAIEIKSNELQQQKHNEQLSQLFALLERSIDTELSEDDFSELPKRWKIAYKNSEKPQYSREDLSIMLDIISAKESDANEQERRQVLQLQMLETKLQEGENLSIDDIFLSWIKHGSVQNEQLELLQRLKNIVLHK